MTSVKFNCKLRNENSTYSCSIVGEFDIQAFTKRMFKLMQYFVQNAVNDPFGNSIDYYIGQIHSRTNLEKCK